MSKEEHTNGNGEQKAEEEELKLETFLPSHFSVETLLTELIGSFGWWQAKFCLFFLIAATSACLHSLMLVFIAPNVNYWCIDGEQRIDTLINTNQNDSSIDGTIGSYNRSIHSAAGNQCWVAGNQSAGQHCTQWDYDVGKTDSYYKSTIISEWNLVCTRSWLASFSQSIYMIGVMFSQFVMSHFSDRYGRKPVILVGVGVSFLAAFSCTFSTTIEQFLISRFFLAFGSGSAWSTCFVLLNEIVGAKYRDLFSYCMQIGWAVGYMVLPGIAYATRDFRDIVLICSIVQAFHLFFVFSMPESPRWLLVSGQVDRAIRAIRHAAKVNNRLSRPNFEQNIFKLQSYYNKLQLVNEQRQLKEPLKQYSILDLFCNWSIARMTIIIYFIWITNNLVYYGLSINTNDLAGDSMLNFVLLGAVEIPAYISCIFLAKRFGNRMSILWTMIGAGLGTLLTMTIASNYYLGIVGAMLGKFCVTCSFSIVYVFSTQIYPTVFRTIGLGTSAMAGKVGSVISPFIKELSQVTHLNVSLSLLGILSIISGICILLLPDNKDEELPDRPEDIEMKKH